MLLQDTTAVAASPERVFAFFEHMDRHYLAWHPDHVRFEWRRGRGVQPGNVFYFEETIAGKLLKKEVRFTRVLPARELHFAPTFWLMRLFLPRMSFLIQPSAQGCTVVAEVVLRMGPVAQWLHRRELAAVRAHMRLEGVNLKKIVEAPGA